MRRKLPIALVMGLLLAAIGVPVGVQAAAPPRGGFSADEPGRVAVDQLVGVTLHFPADVAAVDGRAYFAAGLVEAVGVAPESSGNGLRPVEIDGGAAFGAYGLTSVGDQTSFTLVLDPKFEGRTRVAIVIDDAADQAGNRIDTRGMATVVTLLVGNGNAMVDAPAVAQRQQATRSGGGVRDIHKDGRITIRDLDNARGAWDVIQASGTVCGLTSEDDVNNDGCVDIVDLQALLANQSKAPNGGAIQGLLTAVTLAVAGHTFVVNNTGDTVDQSPGDGICADSSGNCTLRAAINEAEYSPGDDRIEFNLAGTPPVRIQLGSRLPMITSSGGNLTIDGYTEPGSSANTLQSGTNAIPGVEVRGNGTAAHEWGFYITSANNTIRGINLNNLYRAIILDGANATNNKIVGNYIGYTVTGGNAGGQYGIIVNTGAHGNFIGTPVLADRNYIGYRGIDNYGPGTDGNTTQNNVFCIQPNGSVATCPTAIDHNFGPKNNLIGGSGLNERNIIGPTTLQGIEFSHGWNPADHSQNVTYQVNNNRAIGNWVGFRVNGSYAATYRSGLNFSNADNGQAINCYDSSNNNLIEGNYVASVYDGIQLQYPFTTGNIVRNNFIGVSPLGENAPLTRWGIIVRAGTIGDVIEGNTIRNAAAGGVGLLITNNNGTSTAPAFNIKITRNIITGTSGPAIDLFGVAGPDPNDVGDGDSGANTLLNTPTIGSASTSSVSGTAYAGATVELYLASRPAGQYGLPTAYLGSAVANGGGNWTIPVSLQATDLVTALQIMPDGNTSELAANAALHVNQAPVVDTATIAPTDPATDQTLTASYTAHDPDNDPLTPAYQWTRNGTDIAGATASTLNLAIAGNGNRGDLIRVRVTVSDGGLTSAPVTSSPVTVINTAPTATVSLSPSNPSTNAVLTATATKADLDADTVTLTYVWKVNGAIRKTTANSSSLTDTLDLGVAGNGDPGDVVSVEVTPNDGTVNGTLASAQVTVVAGQTVYASDSFSRTSVDTWASATVGGAYTLSGTAANFDVNGAAGTMSVAAAQNRAAFLAVSAQDVDLSFSNATDKVAAGANQFVYGIARRVSTTNEYRAKIRYATNGAVYLQATAVVNNVETGIGTEVLVVGLTHGANTVIRVRAQFQGTNATTIRMRAWADGSAEPSTWQYTASDSTASLQAAGGVGLRVYMSGSISNSPVLVSFDDLSATSIAP